MDTNPSNAPGGATIAMSCSSSTFCAAVGFYQSTADGVPKAEAWLRLSDGKWHTNTVTDNANKELTGVSCLSSTFCVAVGTAVSDSSSAGLPVAYRFDGTSWTPTSAISTVAGDSARSVSCVSTTWCLASGTRGAVVTTTQKRPAGNLLRSMASPAAPDAPTPTTARIWRYNGTRWDVGSAPTIAGTAAVTLNAVSCRSTSFCLTAGAWSYNGTAHPWTGSFNGTKWATSAPTAPTGSSTILYGISCPTTGECTTVGAAQVKGSDGSTAEQPFAGVLSANTWTTATVPGPADGSQAGLNSVSCAAPGSCTAVGTPTQFKEGGQAFAVTRSGTSWSQDTTPTSSGQTAAVAASVSCTSATSCVASGGLFTGSGFKEYLMSKPATS